MNTSDDLKVRFLNTFRGELQENIIEFGKKLWDKDSDIFIFMARKAACFFDCLRELKIGDVRGVAVNDRILDMDLSFLKEKSVTLVDDCIFSGTTLYEAREKILKAGCRSCDTMSLSINKDWIRSELLPGKNEAHMLNLTTPLFHLDDSQSIQQCYDIVQAISIIPRPYDADFPHSLIHKVTGNDLDKLLHCFGWQSYDVSSKYQVENNVRTFTFIPDDHVLNCIFKEYKGLIPLIQTAKIRAYTRKNSDNDNWSVRLVPMVVLGGISIESFSQFKSSLFDELVKEIGACSVESKYRLLHYLYSRELLKKFNLQISRQYNVTFKNDIRKDLAEMSFGSSLPAFCETNFLTNLYLPGPIETTESATAKSYRKETGETEKKTDTLQDIITEITAPFTWLYKKQELPARTVVKEKGLLFKDKSTTSPLNRLKAGFSLNDLISHVCSDAFDVKKVGSIYLDKIVDLGIAVPTIVNDGKNLLRAFRHGEDAVYGEAEEGLLLEFLTTYCSTRKKEVYSLEFQKAIVLFFQIAIRDGNLLERLKVSGPAEANIQIISNKGYLHGLVPMIRKKGQTEKNQTELPYVDKDNDSAEWFIQYMKEKELITIEKKGNKKLCTLKNSCGCVTNFGENKKRRARRIGRCLGELVEAEGSPLNNDTGLIALSTCGEADHQLRALSGEINILVNNWTDTINKIKEIIKTKKFAKASSKFTSLNFLYTAVNSGAMKYCWFINGEFSKLKNSVSTYIHQTIQNESLLDDWEELWPDNPSPSRDNTPTKIWDTIEAMGKWLISVNIAIRIFRYWLTLKADINGEIIEKNKDTSFFIFSDCMEWCDKYLEFCKIHMNSPIGEIVTYFKACEHPASIELVRTMCEKASCFIENSGLKAMRKLLADAELLCSCYGAIGEFRSYPYAVWLELEEVGISDNQTNFLSHLLIQDLLDEDMKILPNSLNAWEKGCWIILRGNRNSNKAAELCSKIARKCIIQSIFFKMILIGQLSNDESIRDMEGSLKLAKGDFFTRLDDLKSEIVSEQYNNEIIAVNEITEGGNIAEGRKITEMTHWKLLKQETFTSQNNLLLAKKFHIEKIRAGGPNILLLATEWASKHGGLSSFNRELCLSLARQGAYVACYVPSASDKEVRNARDGGVSLLVPPGDFEREELSMVRKPILPEGFQPEIIIGHDRITGDYANLLAENHFPHSKKVLFIHTAPEEIEWYKEKKVKEQTADAAERKRIQLNIAKQCDLVVAVGPHLYSEFSTDLRGINSTVPIHEFIPGLFTMLEEDNLKPPSSTRCLILGRAEDYSLKGLGLAAKALGTIASHWNGDSALKLIVRGVPVNSEEKLIQKLKEDCGTDSLDIVIRCYSPHEKDLKNDLRESSLLLMPSLMEGFGLVGLEAISCGIPILISEKSGLAKMLKKYVPDRVAASTCVLPVSGENFLEKWIHQLNFFLSCPPKRELAFTLARKTRDELRQKISWNKSTKLLIDKFYETLNSLS